MGLSEGSHGEVWSRTLAGDEARCYSIEGELTEDGWLKAAGSFYWSVPSLLEELGWGSVAKGQAAAHRIACCASHPRRSQGGS